MSLTAGTIRRRTVGWVGAAAVLLASAGCATRPRTAPDGSTVVDVVAVENFWGSLARQLGGTHVKVTSIISNPNADPHDYEPTARDGRDIAAAQVLIVNGVGYDTWA